MNSLRLWVVLLALVSFLAGAAAGVWATAAHLQPAAPAGPFEEYRRMLLASFSLPPERAKHLDTILAAYAKEIEDIKNRRMADTISSMGPELAERGSYYRSLIQDRVLPEDQRERFKSMALGLPTNTN